MNILKEFGFHYNSEPEELPEKLPAQIAATPPKPSEVHIDADNSAPRYLSKAERQDFAKTAHCSALFRAALQNDADDWEVLWEGGNEFLFARSWAAMDRQVVQ